MTQDEICKVFEQWSELMLKSERFDRPEYAKELEDAFRTVKLHIYKSCLLDRVLYGGEKISQTPCPVHKGRWSGIHFGWPGVRLFGPGHPPEGTPAPELVEKQCQEWYDAGCRCFQHTCGCTTGWQPET